MASISLFKSMKRIWLTISALVLVLLLSASVSANTISQGYQTDEDNLSSGMAVSLVGGNDSKVTGATLANSDNFVGIITTLDQNLISVRDEAANVLVTTNGEVLAYVSDISGEIKTGDVIGLSPLKGILASTQNASKTAAVGVALEDFPLEAAERKSISTQSGETREVNVAQMSIKLGRDTAAVVQEEQQNDSFLVIAGESVTGQSVNQAQVIAAILILLIVMIVEGSIIYGAIHSTIVSLGRNPLSKKAVFKQLLQVSWLALLVLVFGFGAIFLVLWI
jgi:hypothetical protein